MKGNMKFFTVVISLLLLSAMILTGCMYTIAADHGETKPYDLNGQEVSNGGSDGSIVEGKPTAQDSLRAKFEEMYDISEDGKTITVISEAFLDEYWYDLKAHSLSADEVYYIIQDSIRIYSQYDTVILSGFGSFASDSRHAYIVPYIREDVVIKTQPNETPYYEWDDTAAIYEIIMYRLKALSSPKAFFTGEEAMRFAGGEPGINSTMLPGTTFYIPDYSESTNRDYILFVVGYSNKMNSTVDVDSFSDLFRFCNKNEASISFQSKNNEQPTKVYPTAELDDRTYPYFSIHIPELDNALLEHRQDYKVYIDGDYLCGGLGNGCENLILKDITDDGKPELCFVMNLGSGIVDFRILIFDYETRECIFLLSDRGYHDYGLFVRDGVLCVSEREYMGLDLTRTGILHYDGSKVSVSWDAEVNYPYDWPTDIPIEKWEETQ